MPEFYLDFDTKIVEAKDYEEALKKGRKVVEEMKENNEFPNWHISEA